MRKTYGIASLSAASAVLGLVLGVGSAIAATPLTSAVQATVQMGTGVNSSTNVAASSSTNVDVSGNTNSSSTVMSMGGTNDNGSANGMLNANINIGSGDATLTTYAQSMAANDPSISAVSTTNNNVSVSYKVPVKLFGFIPVHETETATVDTSDQTSAPKVSVHRSWWSFLAAGNNSSAAATFSTELNTRVGTSGAASAQSQEQIMGDIEAAAQSSMNMSASASGSASAGNGY